MLRKAERLREGYSCGSILKSEVAAKTLVRMLENMVAETLLKLAKALYCEIEEMLEFIEW